MYTLFGFKLAHPFSSQLHQNKRTFYLIAFTFITDILWLFLWAIFWFWDKRYFPKGFWENGLHIFCVVCSGVNLLIKVSLGLSLNHTVAHHHLRPSYSTTYEAPMRSSGEKTGPDIGKSQKSDRLKNHPSPRSTKWDLNFALCTYVCQIISL